LPAGLTNFVTACGLAHFMAAYGSLRRRLWGLEPCLTYNPLNHALPVHTTSSQSFTWLFRCARCLLSDAGEVVDLFPVEQAPTRVDEISSHE